MKKELKLRPWALLLIFPLLAKAYDPYQSRCSVSFSRDSYALGLKEAFIPSSLRPHPYFDQECFNLGYNQALQLYERDTDFCLRDFKAGLKEGLVNPQMTYGSNCKMMGLKAAQGDLGMACRLDHWPKSNADLRSAYQQGIEDARRHIAMNEGHFSSKAMAYCYSLGHYESSL